MPFRVDDKFHSHAKIKAISLAARGLWVSAGSWSSDHRRGGVVPDHVLADLGSTPELEGELLRVGLWHRIKRGIRFHEWDLWNDTAEKAEKSDAEAERNMLWAAERQRRKRAKDREAGERDVTRDTDPELREPVSASRSRHAPGSVTVTLPGDTGPEKAQLKPGPVTRDISVTASVTSRSAADLDQDHDFDSDPSLGQSVKVRNAGAREPKPGTAEFRLQVQVEMAGRVPDEISDATADAITDEVLGSAKGRVLHRLAYVLKAIRDEADPRARWLPRQPARDPLGERVPHCRDPHCDPRTRRREHPETGADLGPCSNCSGYQPAWEAS